MPLDANLNTTPSLLQRHPPTALAPSNMQPTRQGCLLKQAGIHRKNAHAASPRLSADCASVRRPYQLPRRARASLRNLAHEASHRSTDRLAGTPQESGAAARPLRRPMDLPIPQAVAKPVIALTAVSGRSLMSAGNPPCHAEARQRGCRSPTSWLRLLQPPNQAGKLCKSLRMPRVAKSAKSQHVLLRVIELLC